MKRQVYITTVLHSVLSKIEEVKKSTNGNRGLCYLIFYEGIELAQRRGYTLTQDEKWHLKNYVMIFILHQLYRKKDKTIDGNKFWWYTDFLKIHLRDEIPQSKWYSPRIKAIENTIKKINSMESGVFECYESSILLKSGIYFEEKVDFDEMIATINRI